METNISLDKLSLLNFDTKTIVSQKLNGAKQSFNAKIDNFGYEVVDNEIAVIITTDEKFLPGTTLEITFEIINEMESLYILKQMLMKDGDVYYVEVENNEGFRQRKDIEIGDFFEIYNGNTDIEYVTVVSGLQEGEKLIIDIIE